MQQCFHFRILTFQLQVSICNYIININVSKLREGTIKVISQQMHNRESTPRIKHAPLVIFTLHCTVFTLEDSKASCGIPSPLWEAPGTSFSWDGISAVQSSLEGSMLSYSLRQILSLFCVSSACMEGCRVYIAGCEISSLYCCFSRREYMGFTQLP